MSTLYQLHFILAGEEYAYLGSQSQVPRVKDRVVLGQAILYEVQDIHWRYDLDSDCPSRIPVDVFISKVRK